MRANPSSLQSQAHIQVTQNERQTANQINALVQTVVPPAIATLITAYTELNGEELRKAQAAAQQNLQFSGKFTTKIYNPNES